LIMLLILSSNLCYAKKRAKKIKKKKPTIIQNEKFVTFKKAKIIIGNINEFVGDVQIDNNGTMNEFTEFEFKPIFGIGVDLKTKYSFELSGEILLTLPESLGDADDVTKQLFLARVDIQKEVIDNLFIKGGTTWFITYISGEGGTQSLSNGGGSTAFPKPAKSTFSHNFTLDGSVEYLPMKTFGIKLHTMLFNIHDKEQFAWSYILSANIYLDLNI
jgi:hypothetical protein